MSSLLTAVESAQSAKKSTGSASEKNPAFYNRQKNAFIAAMITHSDPVVRTAAASDNHCPTKQIQAALAIERDEDTLKALLYNPNLPVKSIVEFSKDEERSVIFDEDDELKDYLVARVSNVDSTE